MNTDTKSTLLKVTRELIDSKGIGAVSMREVGRKSGLSRTALYRHFDGKQSLLAAIVNEDFEILLAGMIELEKFPASPRQLLALMLTSYYSFGQKSPDHYQLMFHDHWDPEIYPEIKEVASGLFRKTAEYVYNALKESGSEKYTPQETTAVLFAFIHGLVELHLAGHNEKEKGLDDPDLLINRMIDYTV